MGYVEKITRFVGKSMMGEEMQRAEIIPTGIRYDRMIVLVTDGPKKRLLSQRTPGCQKLGLVKVNVDESSSLIHIAFPEGRNICVSMNLGSNLPPQELERFDLHGDEVLGIDTGDEAAEAFRSFLKSKNFPEGIPCRLMLSPSQAPRRISKAHAKYFPDEGYVLGQDKAPVSVISNKSVPASNNAAILIDPNAIPLEEDSLRTGLVFGGFPAYAEEFIGRVKIGKTVVLSVQMDAERCSMIGAKKGKIHDPLAVKLLTQVYNQRTGEKVPRLGALAIVETPGWIEKGDKVEILSWRSLPQVLEGLDDQEKALFYARHNIIPPRQNAAPLPDWLKPNLP